MRAQMRAVPRGQVRSIAVEVGVACRRQPHLLTQPVTAILAGRCQAAEPRHFPVPVNTRPPFSGWHAAKALQPDTRRDSSQTGTWSSSTASLTSGRGARLWSPRWSTSRTAPMTTTGTVTTGTTILAWRWPKAVASAAVEWRSLLVVGPRAVVAWRAQGNHATWALFHAARNVAGGRAGQGRDQHRHAQRG